MKQGKPGRRATRRRTSKPITGDDLVSRIQREINARMADLAPAVDEAKVLEQVLEALERR